MIGIVLSPGIRKQNLPEKTRQRVDFYRKQAKKHKVDLCFYNWNSVSLQEKTVKALVYSYKTGGLVRQEVPLPKINLQPGTEYVNSERVRKKVTLLRKQNYIFFNVMNNRDRNKFKNHEYFSSIKEIAPMLPETHTLSYAKMKDMADRYEKVYIKRKRSCKGNNIYVVEKGDNAYTISHVYNTKETIKKIPKKELYKYYRARFASPKSFVVQQGIDSKQYNGKKFDFRVSPQKTKTGHWKVIGFYARLADKCVTVTNKDQGGRLKFSLKPLISDETREEIKNASIKIAKILEEKYPQVIDLGLDLAVDKDEKIWLIEANFRPFRGRINSKHHRAPFGYVVWYYKRNAK